MDVIDDCAALLTDYEVLAVLRERETLKKRQSGKSRRRPENVATIELEAKRFLESRPCNDYAPENVQLFLAQFSNVKLTKAEKLQILNARPTSVVHLYPELETRFGENEIEDLMDRINASLPQEEAAPDAEDGNNGDDNEAHEPMEE